jgi:serine protease
MKRFKLFMVWVVLALVMAGLLIGSRPSRAASSGLSDVLAEPSTDQIIIQYKENLSADLAGPNQADEMERLSQVAGVELAYYRPMSGDAHVLRLPQALPESEVAALTAKLATLPEVAYAEPDAIMLPMDTIPNDLHYSEQWHYFAPGADHYGINAPAAWDITKGSSAIVVAVIDTGITDHPDLAGRWIGGYDFISDAFVGNDGNGRDSDPHDTGDGTVQDECGVGFSARPSSWHGTHVAGTIGAVTNNNSGVAGINWISPIMPVRVLGKCGGYTTDIADGMRWAAGLAVTGVPANPNPAKVLNLSLGSTVPTPCSTTYQNAINDITTAGSAIVISAGNSGGLSSDYSPGNCTGVITVAATDRYGSKASYSNSGSAVEISAPGGSGGTGSPNAVLSSLNSGTLGLGAPSYQYYNGTSMSAPHVSGVASLVLSLGQNLTPAQVLQILQQNVTPFPGGSSCNTGICGSGIVNAYGAVSKLPRITNISPSAVMTNTGPLVLTVYGANFTSGAKIYFNDETAARPTYVINTTQLTTTLTLTDTHGVGVLTFYVKDNYSGIGTVLTPRQAVSIWANPLYLPLLFKNLPGVPGIMPGYWGASTMELYVSPDQLSVTNFAMGISVAGCGSYKIRNVSALPITNRQFSLVNKFYGSGKFGSDATVLGQIGLNSFPIPNCGTVSGGPWYYSAVWLNSNQPALAFFQATLDVPYTGNEPIVENGDFIIEYVGP